MPKGMSLPKINFAQFLQTGARNPLGGCKRLRIDYLIYYYPMENYC